MSRASTGDRKEGIDELETISGAFSAELVEANSRLTQFLTPREVLIGIRRSAVNKSWILLQPGDSGYAWSDRTVPMVFIVCNRRHVRFRVRRGHCRRGYGQTPAIWPELRGFMAGDMDAKIAAWIAAPDGGQVGIATALKLPEGDLSCSIQEWR